MGTLHDKVSQKEGSPALDPKESVQLVPERRMPKEIRPYPESTLQGHCLNDTPPHVPVYHLCISYLRDLQQAVKGPRTRPGLTLSPTPDLLPALFAARLSESKAPLHSTTAALLHNKRLFSIDAGRLPTWGSTSFSHYPYRASLPSL